MRWQRFFDDLEHQLASEREAERAALDSEAERLRLSRVVLRDRLAALADAEGAPASLALVDGAMHTARVTGVGADWIALDPADGRGRGLVVPLSSIESVGVPHPELLRSTRPSASSSSLAERMTFGFVIRDLVRRRAPVALHLAHGRIVAGTIDRAGADHLDLALHEPGSPRRSDSVTGHRMVAFSAIACVSLDRPALR